MNKTTENLFSALKAYVPPIPAKTVYRLVYDPETGKPVCVVAEPTDHPHIEITEAEASAQPQLDPRLRVENGKLVKRVKQLSTAEEPNRLAVKPADDGNIATDDYSMLIINNSGTNRWTYD